MIIYVRNENKTIRVLSTSELHGQLTATPHTTELDPYLIGYSPDFNTHFLFTIQEGQLRRFGIRSDKTTHFFQTEKIYFPMPGYHLYDTSKQIFSPTPIPGRFTQNRNFTLNSIAFLTSNEIEKHCPPKTQIIDITNEGKIPFPYLIESNLTETEQRTLYFDAVIPGCDRFHQTLITVHENFNNPANILTTVITNEDKLSEITLTSEEKKHVEKILLPFFIPEYINQIEKLKHIAIGDVLDFYFHAVKKTLEKINSNFYICDEKKYSQEIKNTLIGQLPRTHCSYRGFWKQPEKSNDNALIAENDAIFRFIGTIFGISTHNNDEFKLLVRTLIQSEGMITHRTHLLQAITDYCNTLSDAENNLHFSPQYQSAYDILSASYPIPNDHQTQIDILKKLRAAQFILQNYIHINTVIHSKEMTLNSTDCIVLFKYLTKKELTLFLEKQKQRMIATLRNIYDFEVFAIHCDENELTLLFSILSAGLTSLVEHNRSYFDALLKNHTTSCEIKCIIIFTLPVELAADLLTDLFKNDQLVFFKLISSALNHEIFTLLEKIQPELLANAIQNIQNFTQIFPLYNRNEKIFLLTADRIIQLINSTSDFCKVCSVLTSKQQKYIHERISNKLPTFVKTIEDFQHIFAFLDGEQANELLSQIRKHLPTIITTPIRLSIFLLSINETQLEITIPFITNTFSIIKTHDDFIQAFFHTSLKPEKLFLIFEYFIDMRNRKLHSSTGDIGCFTTSTTPSNIIFLLATTYFIYLNYDGEHKQKLDDFLKKILLRPHQNQTITTILTKLKEFSGFDDQSRNGKLHNAMKLVITAFEKSNGIDVAELIKITKGSRWIPNCCAAK